MVYSDETWDARDVAKYLKLLTKGVPNKDLVNSLLWRDPSFPRPFKLGEKTNRWDPAEIRAWVLSRPRAADVTIPDNTGRGRPPKAKRGRPAIAGAK